MDALDKQAHEMFLGRCAVCGKSLAGKRASARTCSAACRQWLSRHRNAAVIGVALGQAAGAPQRTCLVCGEPLRGRRRDTRFCGPACKQRARRWRQRQARTTD
jgi:predicted nucleic acid-binding Zn ribbon protein